MNFPRSLKVYQNHDIKQSRGKLNATYHIERTPGIYPGAGLNFTSTLFTLCDHVNELLRNAPELKGRKIQGKLSGDGATS